MTSTQIAQSIFEQIKSKLSKQFFDDAGEINFSLAGKINDRYLFDIQVSISASDFIDDPDNDNNFNVRTFYGISTECTLCMSDWKGDEIDTKKIELILENLITKEIETN